MLSGAQKTELRFYCGYSVLDEDSPVARAISALDSRPDSLPIILRELEVCKGIDGDLKKVPTLAMATQDGAIQLRAHYTLSVLQHQGRQAAGRRPNRNR